MDYDKALKLAIEELEYMAKFYDGVTIDQLLDEPIYTENEELRTSMALTK